MVPLSQGERESMLTLRSSGPTRRRNDAGKYVTVPFTTTVWVSTFNIVLMRILTLTWIKLILIPLSYMDTFISDIWKQSMQYVYIWSCLCAFVEESVFILTLFFQESAEESVDIRFTWREKHPDAVVPANVLFPNEPHTALPPPTETPGETRRHHRQ